MHSKLYVYEYTSKEKKVTCTYLGSSTRATHHSVFQRTSIALAFPIAMETVSKPSEAPSWAVQLQDHVWDVCRARAGGCDAGSYMFLNFCVDLFSRLEDCFCDTLIEASKSSKRNKNWMWRNSDEHGHVDTLLPSPIDFDTNTAQHSYLRLQFSRFMAPCDGFNVQSHVVQMCGRQDVCKCGNCHWSKMSPELCWTYTGMIMKNKKEKDKENKKNKPYGTLDLSWFAFFGNDHLYWCPCWYCLSQIWLEELIAWVQNPRVLEATLHHVNSQWWSNLLPYTKTWPQHLTCQSDINYTPLLGNRCPKHLHVLSLEISWNPCDALGPKDPSSPAVRGTKWFGADRGSGHASSVGCDSPGYDE